MSNVGLALACGLTKAGRLLFRLKKSVRTLDNANLRIHNADVTLVGQSTHMRPSA